MSVSAASWRCGCGSTGRQSREATIARRGTVADPRVSQIAFRHGPPSPSAGIQFAIITDGGAVRTVGSLSLSGRKLRPLDFLPIARHLSWSLPPAPGKYSPREAGRSRLIVAQRASLIPYLHGFEPPSAGLNLSTGNYDRFTLLVGRLGAHARAELILPNIRNSKGTLMSFRLRFSCSAKRTERGSTFRTDWREAEPALAGIPSIRTTPESDKMFRTARNAGWLTTRGASLPPISRPMFSSSKTRRLFRSTWR
jgi:hypothetical protein